MDIFKVAKPKSLLDKLSDICQKYSGNQDAGGEEVIDDILNLAEGQYGEEGDEEDGVVLHSALLILQKYQEDVPSSLTVITDIKAVLEEHGRKQEEVSEVGGFGKMEPVVKETPKEESDSDGELEEWGSGQFISAKRIRKGRISQSEMKSLNVFKKYNRGQPTTRLYVKNIHTKTTEQDLHYIFGRYINWENEEEKNMFDIRLLKEGKMKGQAFIVLGSEEKAIQAVNDTNGFELNGKPMVVQFSTSAKAKEKDGERKDKK